MTKILGPNDTGFGILIERDAGYIDKTLNKNIITEDFKVEPNKPLYINCVLQKWGVENKNGRIYPEEVLVPQINEYGKLIKNGSAPSEADHPDCVSASESMICTKDGWKNFEDISDDEEILTLNTGTNKIEVQKIDKKIYLDYQGKMYKFSGKNLDLTVTGNHRFLLENKRGVREYHYAKDIYENKNNILSSGSYKILKNAEWNGEHKEYYEFDGVDPNTFSFNLKKKLIEKYSKPIKIKSEDWFAFLGIYLADGHCSGTVSNKYMLKGYDVVITQKKEKSKLEIETLLNKLPFEYYKIEYFDGKTQYHITDARLYNYLYDLGNSYTKFIPQDIKQASSDLLRILFDWFLIGDGRNITIKNQNNKKSVFSSSERLINDLHEVLIKIGGNGNITTYQPLNRYINDVKRLKREVVLPDGSVEYEYEDVKKSRLIESKNSKIQHNLHISNTKNIWLDKRSIKIEEIDFDDKIACVRVKNGNFLVRVNGKSHWTGNSSIISLHNISHMITDMWWGKGEQKHVVFGTIKLIISPGFINMGIVSVIGDKILLYLQNGMKLGISSRGVGSLKELNGKNLVQDDFELIGFDLVATPSTPGAYLFPGVENIEQAIGENIVKKEGQYLKEDSEKIIDSLNRFLL